MAIELIRSQSRDNYQNNPQNKKDASRACYNADPNKAKKAARKQYSTNHPEPKKRAARKQYSANPEPKKRAARKQYSANPEPKKRAARKQYSTNHPEPKKRAARKQYSANPEPKKRAARKQYSANPEPKKRAARKHYSANPEPKKRAARKQYSANPEPKKRAARKQYSNHPEKKGCLALNSDNICAQKRANYALGEPKLDVKDMYVKEILSHLLADAEARSRVSDSSPKMNINDKINISVKAMCRVAAKKLLNKTLQICREHAGSLLQAARLVQSMELTDTNDFSDGCHMASTEPFFYDSAYKLVKREYALPIDTNGRCTSGDIIVCPVSFHIFPLLSVLH